MFDTVLSEFKLARTAINDGKWFTGLSHGGKSATGIGDIGAKYFEGGDVISVSAEECSDEMLLAFETECEQLKPNKAEIKASGGKIDWFNLLVESALDLAARIRASRKA